MKNPLVQIDAVNQYEKSNEKTSKDYPSLELVRLEKLFFEEKKVKFWNMHLEADVIPNFF